jgi:hypothetical protein
MTPGRLAEKIKMEFLSTGKFWVFFVLIGFFSFVYQYGRGTRGQYSSLIKNLGGWAMMIITILAFVFMWWQGGLAILISWLIWAIITGITNGLLIRRARTAEDAEHEKARQAFDIIERQKELSETSAMPGETSAANSPEMFPGIEEPAGEQIDSTETKSIETASPLNDNYFIGNARTKIFHKPECPMLPYPIFSAEFDSLDEAAEKGYKPCKKCMPEHYVHRESAKK